MFLSPYLKIWGNCNVMYNKFDLLLPQFSYKKGRSSRYYVVNMHYRQEIFVQALPTTSLSIKTHE